MINLRLPGKALYRVGSAYSMPGTEPAFLSASKRILNAQRRILLEGVPADIASRIMGTFVTPFALALKATGPQIGLLTAIPQLLASLAQLATPRLIEMAGSRRRFFVIALLLSGLIWVPIAVLPWLFDSAKVWWFLGLVTVAVTLFSLPGPAWGSWVGQLIPADRRGRFLGARATVASLVGVLTILGLGRLLDMMNNRLFVAFSGVFFSVVLLRIVSLLLLCSAYEPPLPTKKAASRSSTRFGTFVKEMPRSNLGRFLGINALFQFAVCLAGPFFVVLMLRDLGFSYTTVILLQLVCAVSSMVGLQLWGALADKAGNIRVLRASAPLIGVMTLLWLVNQSPWWLAAVEVLGGFAWAGYNIASQNFVYETSSDQERARNVGYFSALAGIGVFVGSSIGGLLASVVPAFLSYNILTLVLISGVLRLTIGLFLIPVVKEVREGVPATKPWPSAVLHLAPLALRGISLRRAKP